MVSFLRIFPESIILILHRFHYPQDVNAAAIQLQFFYGPCLLVSPVTEGDATAVEIYLPEDRYYDFSTLQPIDGTKSYLHLTNISFTDIPVHIRGGSIVPLRVSGANTTTELRKKDFELLIAPDTNGAAEGDLYLDDGESLVPENTSEIRFKYTEGTLKMSGTFGYDVGNVKIAKITVLGDAPVVKKLDAPLTMAFNVVIKSLPAS